MIPSSRLEELAAKCEKATGGFPETRALLFEAYEALLPANGSFMVACIHAGAFLDAAITLVPEGAQFTLTTVGPRYLAYINGFTSRAVTLALALCAAALRAHAKLKGEGNE